MMNWKFHNIVQNFILLIDKISVNKFQATKSIPLYIKTGQFHLRWIPTKKVKVLWFSWKFGKIKKMRAWFHSRKDSVVNPT